MRAFFVGSLVVLLVASGGVRGTVSKSKSHTEDKREFKGAPVKTRSQALPSINTSVLDFIAQNLQMSKAYVKERWADDEQHSADSLPEALSQMDKGNDERIAHILAQLMGTMNTDLIQSVFKNTKNEFIRFNALPEPTEAQKIYGKFLERMLFAIYSWPTEKDPKQAYCGAALPQNGANTLNKRDTDNQLQHLKELASRASAVVATTLDNVAKGVDQKCFGKDADGSYKYKPYGKFINAFNEAADEVWKHNLAYHEKADAFNTAKAELAQASTNEEKANKAAAALAAAQEISKMTSGKELFAYAEQQRRTPPKKGSSVDTTRADTAYSVMAWNQAGGPSKKLSLKDAAGNPVEVDWSGKGAAPSSAAKTAFKQYGDAAPYLWPKPKSEERQIQAKVQEDKQPQGEEAKQKPSTTNTSQKDPAPPKERTVALDSKASEMANSKCMTCHKGSDSLSENFSLTGTSAILTAKIGTMASYERMSKVGSMSKVLSELTNEEIGALKTLLGN